MTNHESTADYATLLKPDRYVHRQEPAKFDPSVHTAGALDWLIVTQGDTSEYAKNLIP